MSRWLGIDHGRKRIGLAVGNTEQGIATPLSVLDAAGLETLAAKVALTAAQYGLDGVVVGWPINMDGSEGPQGRLARQWAVRLAEMTGLDVRLWDERLSSFDADGLLAGHMTRMKRRSLQDAVAAASMLKDFLARNGPETAPKPQDANPPDQRS
jgi:putative Holliday junction resolvase